MSYSIPEPLLNQECIAARVAELGAQITRDHAGHTLLLIAVLKGSLLFAADLMRAIDLPIEVEFITASSYNGGTRTGGAVSLRGVPDLSVRGRRVLLVEDIVDSGLTLSALRAALESREVASLSVCTLLDKPARRQVSVNVDYVGFRIENHFVVGYGLDHRGLYRNLPYIGVCKAGAAESE